MPLGCQAYSLSLPEDSPADDPPPKQLWHGIFSTLSLQRQPGMRIVIEIVLQDSSRILLSATPK